MNHANPARGKRRARCEGAALAAARNRKVPRVGAALAGARNRKVPPVGAALAAARESAGGVEFERGTSRSPEPPGTRPFESPAAWFRPARARRVAVAALLLLPLLFLAGSCRKGEQPSAQPAAVQTEETAAPVGASIRDSAEPGLAPYAGLNHARDAAMDSRGRLWVADFGSAAIRVFDASGGYLGGWGGKKGDGQYALDDPCGIAIDGKDVYVADTWNGRITRFTLQGEWKGRTSPDLGLYSPRAVAVAPDGKVWVADSGNHRVLALERDLTNPRTFGRKGAGPAEFVAPIGIAFGPSGNVYVADAGNQRVQVLDSEGRFKTLFSLPNWKPNVEPYIEVDEDETLYITDSLSHLVVAMDSRGNERRRWTADDTGARFLRPTGLALDRKNRILYVVNTDSDSVGKLKLSRKAIE